MALVPGNHDVCWNTSRRAMEQVPDTEYPTNLYGALIKPDSVYRWSWSEQFLFRIADMAAYERRMGYYTTVRLTTHWRAATDCSSIA